MRSLRVALTAGLTAVGFVTAETILPYNPTSVFLSPIDPNIVYIVQPPSIGDVGTGKNGGLAKLNISETIQSSDVEALFIDNMLPLGTGGTQGGGTNAYSAWITPDGAVGLYAGNCDPADTAEPTTGSSLWIHKAEEESEDAGSWAQFADEITPSKELAASGLKWDASYLASTFYFSPTVPGDAKSGSIYTFGGMCPWRGSTGQGKANYTNAMLKMSPGSKDKIYDMAHAGTTSLKPVPEAGSTITGLSPTISNSTAGKVSQAQAYVLIGGHTQGAFIGMSQVAVFSLPQEVWTFQAVEAASEYNTTEPVAPAGSDDGRELKVSKRQKRDGEWKSVPDSRSGHTAVLSSDGSKIIVLGGWVGNLETPAEPQLAVLHLGSGFGGEGEWRWEIPTAKGIAFIEGDGIFGHGAVMLPGDILMIAGGHRIVSSSNTITKREEGSGMSAMFLNTTSMSFLDTYVNPAYAAPQIEDPQAPGYIGGSQASAHDNSKKVGIGAGVGVGVLAILGAIAIYFWYRRKLNRRHTTTREKDLAQLSQSAHWDPNSAEKMQQRISSGSIAYGQAAYGPGNGNGLGDMGYAAPGAAYGPIEYQGYDHGHIDDSSISYVQPLQRNHFQIPRKPPNARNGRGYYQPAPPQATNNPYSSFDFGAGTHSRTNSLGTAGAIHPIYEQDEDDHGEITDSHLIGVARGDTTPTPMEGGDPFDDNNQTQSQRNSAASGSMGRLELRPPPVEPPPKSPLRDQNPRLKLSPSEEKLEKQREVQEWVSDWAAADAYAMGRTASTIHHNNPSLNRNPSLLQAHGRLSPSKTETTASYSGRTDSNLSDQSAVTLSRNDSTSTRTKSLTAFFQSTSGWGLFGGVSNMAQHGTPARRPEVVNNAYPGPASGRVTAESFYPSGSISPGESERSNTLTATGAAAAAGGAHLKPPRSSGSNSNHSSGNGSHSGNSYMTAHSQLSAGFTGLKEQAETLLPRYGDWAGSIEPGSPSKSKGRSRKGSMGWLGSIKKLVGREEWVGSPGTEEGEREATSERGVADYGAYDINTYADSPSPTRINFGGEDPYSGDSYGGMPQRTASAGASLWRRKQGRSDWEDGEDERGMYGGLGTGTGVHRSSTTAAPGRMGRDERAEEEEWDVEKAVQGRQVQVMFTVPKERLRVVNHDISDDESDIGVVRGSSNRSAGSAASARSNRGRGSPIRDLLTGSPQRSPTRESMRQFVDLELGNADLGTPEPSRKGKEVLRDVPSLQPIRHLPPPMTDTDTSDAERDANMTPEPLMVVKRASPSATPTSERRPVSPIKHLPPSRDASPARSDTSNGTVSRPLSPTKSLRSIKSGRVQDLVNQMEKK